jgi:thiol-disulfide isomerase/thioredoxin
MIRFLQIAACASVLAVSLAGVLIFQRTVPRAVAGMTGHVASATEGAVVDAKDGPPAPAFNDGVWINSDALTLASLRGRVVVVDFWTFGCYNCRNTLPSIKRLHDTYGAKGLTVVGVHTPESSYEKEIANVRRSVGSLGIRYPILTDNDYATWNAYGVEAWPTVFILDRRGRVRYKHVGEGAYDEQERTVKTLLAEEYKDDRGDAAKK